MTRTLIQDGISIALFLFSLSVRQLSGVFPCQGIVSLSSLMEEKLGLGRETALFRDNSDLISSTLARKLFIPSGKKNYPPL